MVNDITKIVVAFVAGQITQLVIHAVALNWNLWNSQQIPFCMAGGFIILFALLAGIRIAKPKEKGEHKKTYIEWAKIPGRKDEGRESDLEEGF